MTIAHVVLSTLLGSVLVFVSSAAGDPPPGKGKGQGKAAHGGKAQGPASPSRSGGGIESLAPALLFSSDQERIIREWFGVEENLRGLPPGLAKRDRLPPGLEKQIARNGTLPPGLEKKLHPLPGSLAGRLPGIPDGYRRVILGESVILLDERTSAIVDVLHGVARIAATL